MIKKYKNHVERVIYVGVGVIIALVLIKVMQPTTTLASPQQQDSDFADPVCVEAPTGRTLFDEDCVGLDPVGFVLNERGVEMLAELVAISFVVETLTVDVETQAEVTFELDERTAEIEDILTVTVGDINRATQVLGNLKTDLTARGY